MRDSTQPASLQTSPSSCQEIRFTHQPALDAIGEESDGSHTRGGEHEGSDQNRELARTGIATKHPKREAQRIHA